MRSRPSVLRDFTVDRRVWMLTGVALLIGAGAAVLAVFLLRAIAFATNVFYYHRLSLAMVEPGPIYSEPGICAWAKSIREPTCRINGFSAPLICC